MKKVISFSILLGLLAVLPVGAQPNLIPAEVEGPGQLILVPQVAIDESPAIVPLGSAVDPASGKKVEGLMFIHYKKSPTHKPRHNPGGNGGGETCFAYLAKGAKWKTIENWIMNTANSEGLDGTTLFNLQGASLAKWEDATDGVVGNSSGTNVFGNGTATGTTLVADTSSPDGQNEVYFGSISDPGAIAVTIVWGIFAGPPSGRELVEWDQVYDQVDFDWSAGAAGVAGKMDFDNIATHENGHAGGMAHPSDSCTEETMYRFSANAETKKRTLNSGDIAGIDGLY